MTDKILSKSDLAMFTGTENWYRHPFVRKSLYTDGVKYVAQTAGAYWLIDEIVFKQHIPAFASEEFQVWTLKVNLQEQNAVLNCDDGNGNLIFSKLIHFTDFPLDEIRLYYTNNVLLLPSEY